jgi:hypothetical protein
MDSSVTPNPYDPPAADAASLPTVRASLVTQAVRPLSAARVLPAAIICGLAFYIPLFGIRGAAACLFPGIAQRSWRIAFKGAAAGFLSDVVVTIALILFCGAWEPRESFNRTLVTNLPPGFIVATHAGSPMPNSMKFGFGLVCWSSTIFAIWMAFCPPKLEWHLRLSVMAAGEFAVGVSAVILWTVAPLDEFWHHGAQPFGDLSPVPFLAVFLSTMPICSIIVGEAMAIASRRQLTISTPCVGD